MYSKLEKTPDDLLDQYFELLTNLPLNQLPEAPRDRQKLLALNVVTQYHGEAAAKEAQQAAMTLVRGDTTATGDAVPEFSLSNVEFPPSCSISSVPVVYAKVVEKDGDRFKVAR
jgi:tyrosyl-tRNA synthetase